MVLSSASVHMVEGAPKNGCHQCLCPHGELLLPLACLDKYLISTGKFDSGSYQNISALCPRVCEVFCGLFKSEVSISPSPLGLLKISPAVFQSQIFWGVIFSVQDPYGWEPDLGLRALTPVGEALHCNYSSVSFPPGCMQFDCIVSLSSLPI